MFGLEHGRDERPCGGADHSAGAGEVDAVLQQLVEVCRLPRDEEEPAAAEGDAEAESVAVPGIETARPRKVVRRC